jgi:hypothetical protein
MDAPQGGHHPKVECKGESSRRQPLRADSTLWLLPGDASPVDHDTSV